MITFKKKKNVVRNTCSIQWVIEFNGSYFSEYQNPKPSTSMKTPPHHSERNSIVQTSVQDDDETDSDSDSDEASLSPPPVNPPNNDVENSLNNDNENTRDDPGANDSMWYKSVWINSPKYFKGKNKKNK